MEIGALSTWASWATIIGVGVALVGVGLALFVIVWPQLQMWATKRLVFFSPRLWTFDPGFGPPRRKLPKWCWALERRLVRLHYRESLGELVDRVHEEVLALADGSIFRPNLDAPEDVREIAAYVHAKRRKRHRRLERCR